MMTWVKPDTLLQIRGGADPAHDPAELPGVRIGSKPIDDLSPHRNDLPKAIHLQLPVQGLSEMRLIE
jgi:hypothetical protein